MPEGSDWDEETAHLRRTFDAVADLYRAEFTDELDGKPYDRQLLDDVGGRLAVVAAEAGAPVLEVGGGPGHIGARVAAQGAPLVVSDASLGQLREARRYDPDRSLVAADLARLPVRPGSLAGIVAFYCLIYGDADLLDPVLAGWRRALVPGGLVVASVHAGEGRVHVDDWMGRGVSITAVLRDPDDLAARFERAGFTVTDRHLRPAYPDEHPTDRFYLVGVGYS
jgi:SAM-dependent methyltransferase